GVTQGGELGLVGGHAEEGHGEGGRITSRLLGAGTKICHGLGGRLAVGTPTDGYPVTVEVHGTLAGMGTGAAHQDGRVWLLDGLRIGPHGVEVDVLAVELRLVLGPNRLHGADALSQDLPPL